ncbi:AMME syndrome candidate 1 protein [Salpingoeca rosetta]|uniref:AMME syndrome candidate 1 protein n=1 Tax=Salpingoeca rosetta (strain ATCC 50818 / BSB-021) TaxID=946362 RepID=F2UII2_SALR5|nr:AMME syndrome candidate 1 protein [Salpingoeca rosetta]EGD77031.1 AMME syndrome candidate 1 protein [Salpingoeca rosetta]|eukprot:XP_004990871.1 AMME syndrome candidate 1 protein [Salpingoeca rosetta]
MATTDMAAYCFGVLESHLHDKDHPEPSFDDGEFPLFVTWKKWHDRYEDWVLRGCIGTFSPTPLHEGLREFALTSALRDTRFDPVSREELATLQCGISLLTNFEDAEHHLDWEVGTHGIWIEFKHESGRKRTATFLPEVMPEQGWSKVEAIDALLRKGGYTSKITEEYRKTVKLTRYKSHKIALSYEEWKTAASSSKSD